MSEHSIPVTTADKLTLRLVRYAPPGEGTHDMRKPVLLLHGASAGTNTFTTLEGGLAASLARQHFDPWLLEWRGSGQLIADRTNDDALKHRGGLFNFNAAATHDVTCALDEIHRRTEAREIAAVGFCMGSGILAESIARGALNVTGAKYRVDRVVLMTLGLFYETPADGRLKSEERILERLKGTSLSNERPFVALNPRVHAIEDDTTTLESPWPGELNRMYGDWPGRLKSHGDTGRDAVTEMCNRLGFLYGTPYYHPNLVPAIHGNRTTEPLLPSRFGGIPLDMFIHAGRNVRRGIATIHDRATSTLKDRDLVSNDARGHFDTLEKVTLITGDRNQLWHRNSIDLMYEWLHRGSRRDRIVKHVIPDYGHQDLLWGTHSRRDVYPMVIEGLTESSRTPVMSTAL